MKRLYLGTLGVFLLFVIFVNVISFMTCFNKRQLVNFFYLSERVSSITMLAEHIVFESGLILKKESVDQVSEYINEVCYETGVDPLLVNAMVNMGGLDPYAIDFDGSMGYMRVKPHVVGQHTGKDPYIAKDNIYIGVTYLAFLLDQEDNVERALQMYYTPEKSYGSYNQKIIHRLSQVVYNSYVGSLARRTSDTNTH